MRIAMLRFMIILESKDSLNLEKVKLDSLLIERYTMNSIKFLKFEKIDINQLRNALAREETNLSLASAKDSQV